MERMTVEEAINSPLYRYCRQGKHIHRNSVHIYHKAATPTGVQLALTAPAAEVEAALEKARKASPLSPTEYR